MNNGKRSLSIYHVYSVERTLELKNFITNSCLIQANIYVEFIKFNPYFQQNALLTLKLLSEKQHKNLVKEVKQNLINGSFSFYFRYLKTLLLNTRKKKYFLLHLLNFLNPCVNKFNVCAHSSQFLLCSLRWNGKLQK